MPKPTRARLRLRFLLGPITSSIMRQRRRGELDTTNPRTYAALLRSAIEADRSLRDGAIPANDRHPRRRG